MLEVEVLEIDHTRASELGIQYPGTLTLTPDVTAPATLGSILGRRTRDNLIASPIPSVTLNAHLDDSDTNVLASPRIRVRNKEKAKVHIGDRLPVFTNSVTPLATGAAVTTGTVQYLDVGLKLEVEPDIHSDGEVGIKMSLEVSTAGPPVTNTQSGTTAFQISTRTIATVLRLKDGETQVLAGLIQDKEARSRIMIPGLGEVPALGRLFSSNHNDTAKTEIVLSITPRIVGRTKLQEAQSVEFWSGTESNLRSTPLALHQTGVVSVSAGTGVQQPARTTPLPLRLTPQPTPPGDQLTPPADQPTPPGDQPTPPADQPVPPVAPPPPAVLPTPAVVQPTPPAGQPIPFNSNQ
jgi:general secretion pathway protein D